MVVGTSRDLSSRVIVFFDERKPERLLHHDFNLFATRHADGRSYGVFYENVGFYIAGIN